MARIRISTTVDDDLITRARRAHGAGTDSSLLEAALEALLREYRATEINQRYEQGYAQDQPSEDDWGDVTTFLDAAGKS